MGGGTYDRDVHTSSSTSGWGASTISAEKLNSSSLDKSLDPRSRTLKSDAKHPIVIVLDVTGSNIDFARLVYDKMPMMYRKY